MSKLFISYRRDDTADICGRLYDKLAPHFGADNVFKDVDSIPLGTDFRQVLRDSVAQCAAMLVVIGRGWLNATDPAGRRRLESPNDFVRIEVEAALARNIPVIPVLVQGAAMPHEDELPTSLAQLAYRHGLDVRGDPHFHRDADQLIEQLAPLLQPLPKKPVSQPGLLPDRLVKLGFTSFNRDGIAYILPPLCDVPAGEFLMGSDKGRDTHARDNELPQHRLTLPAFKIARFPVTVAEYACFVRATGRSEPRKTLRVFGPSWQDQLNRTDHPVVNVSWQDAAAYAAWLSMCTSQPWQLPSEAEWEKAARWDPSTHRARIYPWGDSFDQTVCNTSEGGMKGTTPVGTFPNGASPYGAQDMVGNVWEWTSSVFKDYPYKRDDGRESGNSSENHVLRGGSSGCYAGVARGAYRYNNRLDNLLGGDNGFRLVYMASNS